MNELALQEFEKVPGWSEGLAPDRIPESYQLGGEKPWLGCGLILRLLQMAVLPQFGVHNSDSAAVHVHTPPENGEGRAGKATRC